MDVLSIRKNLDELNEDQLQLREAWDSLNYQVNAWKADLNHVLPPALYQTEVWLQEVEELVRKICQPPRITLKPGLYCKKNDFIPESDG